MLTKGNDIILDFFAGSSTTAHSVMLQNATDGGNRQFIMVQLDEKTVEDSPALRPALRPFPTSAGSGIRRAGKQILEDSCHEGWSKDMAYEWLKVELPIWPTSITPRMPAKQTDLLTAVDNVNQTARPKIYSF